MGDEGPLRETAARDGGRTRQPECRWLAVFESAATF